MEKKKRKKRFTIESASLEAMKFSARSEFARHSQSAYMFAWRLGILDSICSHMQISLVYSDVRWDKASALTEGLKHKSKSEFKRKCSGAYCHAKDNGFLDEACAHMAPTYPLWDLEKITHEARKYTTRAAFRRGNVSAYVYAMRSGLMDAVSGHMDAKTSWHKTSALLIARKFVTRSLFHSGCPGAYKHAIEHGYLEEACAHMDLGKYGFDGDKPAILYCMEFTLPGGDVLCKIGITNRTAKLRKQGLGLGDGINAKVVHEVRFTRGEHARAAERQFHRDFAHLKYQGPPIMENGNTELFSRDVINAFISNKGDQR